MENNIATIARLYLGIDSLRPRRRNRPHSYALNNVAIPKRALTAAYLDGYAAGFRAANGSKEDLLPTEEHLMENGEWLGAGPEDPETWPNAEMVITAPIPETELTTDPTMDDFACMVLIPNAVKQRRIR